MANYKRNTKLTEEQKQIAEKFSKFVESYAYYACHKYRLISERDVDELESDLYLVLCTSAQDFQPDKIKTVKPSFRKFVLQNFKHNIFTIKNKESRHHKNRIDYHWSSNRDIDDNSSQCIFLANAVETLGETQFYNEKEKPTTEEIQILLKKSKLTKEEKFVIKQIFYHKEFHKDIAKKCNVSRETIRNYYNNALNKIRTFIKLNNYSYEDFTKISYDIIEPEIPNYQQILNWKTKEKTLVDIEVA